MFLLKTYGFPTPVAFSCLCNSVLYFRVLFYVNFGEMRVSGGAPRCLPLYRGSPRLQNPAVYLYIAARRVCEIAVRRVCELLHSLSRPVSFENPNFISKAIGSSTAGGRCAEQSWPLPQSGN